MAAASLGNPSAVDGGTAWTVEAYPVDEPPFAGPTHRDWDDFEVVPEGAEFQWRTPADRVRRCAERVKEGKLTIKRALRDGSVREWLARKSAQMVPLLCEQDPSARDLRGEALDRRLFVEFAASVSNAPGSLGYYAEDDAAYLRDAAEALELPPWARLWLHDEGGPGSRFTAAAIVIPEGMSMHDLGAWLATRP